MINSYAQRVTNQDEKRCCRACAYTAAVVVRVFILPRLPAIGVVVAR